MKRLILAGLSLAVLALIGGLFLFGAASSPPEPSELQEPDLVTQAWIHLVDDEWDQVITKCRRASTLQPEWLEPRLLLTAAYREQGQWDSVIRTCGEILAISPSNSLAFLNRGRAYVAKQDTARASADFDRAIELNPGIPQAYSRRGRLRAGANDLPGALADFSMAIELQPRSATLYLLRAAAHEQQGRYDKAMQDAYTAVLCSTNDVRPHLQLARLSEQLGIWNNVIEHAQRVLELDPDATDMYRVIAGAQKKTHAIDAGSERLAPQLSGNLRTHGITWTARCCWPMPGSMRMPRPIVRA